MKNEEEIVEGGNKHLLIKILIVGIILIIGGLLYSRFISTSGLKVKEYKITDSSIPDSFYGFKIVQISDVHYGRTVDGQKLKKIVEEISLLKPDLVVLTGDLIDKNTKLTEKGVRKLTDFLNSIDANVGKYAIMGNHDYKFSEWKDIISNGGFTNLDDKYELIYNNGLEPILLAGLSTSYSELPVKPIQERYDSIEDYLKTIDPENSNEVNYKILMLHEPDPIDKINTSYFNMILAGHTHNGQVRIPLIGAVVLPLDGKKYYKEHYKLNSTDLYISSGIGCSGANFRFLNKPSINLYRLTNE